MRIQRLFDRQRRAVFLSDARKCVVQPFKQRRRAAPVFLFGTQRSGTSMIMYAFHMHPDTTVFDEHRDSIAFKDFQIRDFKRIDGLIQTSRTAFCCFKPICDSHRIDDFLTHFPACKAIWAYRDFRPVALSRLKKFGSATKAIRQVCTGSGNGGWFEDGLSPYTLEVLRDIYSQKLSDMDLSCLVWWARNQIFVEKRLSEADQITIVNYETLARSPVSELAWVFSRLGLDQSGRCARFINASSITSPSITLTPAVEALCEQTLEHLHAAYHRQRGACTSGDTAPAASQSALDGAVPPSS